MGTRRGSHSVQRAFGQLLSRQIASSRPSAAVDIVDTAATHYKSDTQTLARWLDVSIVKKKGRAYEPDFALLPAKAALPFPLLKGCTLNLKDVTIPDSIVPLAAAAAAASSTSTSSNSSGSSSSSAKPPAARLVAFHFKHYGSTLVRPWLQAVIARFGPGPLSAVPVSPLLPSRSRSYFSLAFLPHAPSTPTLAHIHTHTTPAHIISMLPTPHMFPKVIEVCFVEYGFLALTKSLFASNLRATVPASQHDLTALSFGGVGEFAAALQLPNKYTGYLYLVDRQNRVRHLSPPPLCFTRPCLTPLTFLHLIRSSHQTYVPSKSASLSL